MNPKDCGRMDLLVIWRVATTDSCVVQAPKSIVGVLNSRSVAVTWARRVKGTGRVYVSQCVCVCVCMWCVCVHACGVCVCDGICRSC